MKAVLRYLGAKNRLADWIVSFFPDHKIYVEPYGGSAAVLLNKAPVEIEVYNDLYDDVVNLFRIIRSDRYVELMEQVNMTPFSEREYELAARDKSGDEIERARKFLVCSFMAVSCDGMFRKTGFRRDRNASCGRVVGKWQRLPDLLAEAHVRLSSVTIRKQDALDIIREYDSPDIRGFSCWQSSMGRWIYAPAAKPSFLRKRRNSACRANGAHKGSMILGWNTCEGCTPRLKRLSTFPCWKPFPESTAR